MAELIMQYVIGSLVVFLIAGVPVMVFLIAAMGSVVHFTSSGMGSEAVASTEAMAVPSSASVMGRVPHEAQLDAEFLKRVDIFRDLSQEQIDMVARLGRVESFYHGSILGVQGSPGNALYVILAGYVQLLTPSPMGQLTVRVAGPGESVPLATLIGSGTLLTTAMAARDLKVLTIPRTQLLNLTREHPDIGMRLYQSVGELLADRYRSTLNRMTQSMDAALQRPELWANV